MTQVNEDMHYYVHHQTVHHCHASHKVLMVGLLDGLGLYDPSERGHA